MNSQMARKIRKFSFLKYGLLDEKYRKLINPRQWYRLIKQKYYDHGRSFKNMAKALST